MDAVWRGVIVEEANLTVQIAALRRILDRGRKADSCIRTVSGRGYRFVAPVVAEAEKAPQRRRHRSMPSGTPRQPRMMAPNAGRSPPCLANWPACRRETMWTSKICARRSAPFGAAS